MTLSQNFSLWALRGLLLWLAIEGGLSAYDFALAKTQQLSALAGQTEAMSKLTTRAREAEARAVAAHARLGSAHAALWPLAPGREAARAAADSLRQSLIDAGAQAPTVDATLAGPTSSPRLHFTARWREPQETAPAVVAALATRYPDLEVTSLHLARANGVVETSAELETNTIASGGGG